MARWLNSDGLDIPLGTTEATVGIAGEFSNPGQHRVIEIRIPAMTALTTSPVIQDYNVWIPKGARIEEVEVEVITACTGTNAALNVGLIKKDQSTAYEADGLVKAAAVTTLDAAGKRLTLITGATAVGDSVGTTMTENAYITADYDTAAFEAGALTIRVKMSF